MTERTRKFEAIALPHLNAAYNLARWLLRNEHDAQDVVQDAYLRAFRFFDAFQGGEARPWLLAIVRNACYTWLQKNRRAQELFEYDDERDGDTEHPAFSRAEDNPEVLLFHKLERKRLNEAIEALPTAFREVLILRELEDLSYADIAQVAAIPIGTVMSRLARARALLRTALQQAA